MYARLEHRATWNADVFVHDLKNYQQSVYILDEVLTAQNNGVSTYTQITGNAPLVRVQGLELDAMYAGIKNLTLRLAAAYNDARYRASPFCWRSRLKTAIWPSSSTTQTAKR